MKRLKEIIYFLVITIYSSSVVNGQVVKKGIIADTVIYKVQIINPELYKADNGYYDYCTNNVEPSKRRAFLDPLFNEIYSGKIPVYNYKTGIAMSKEDVESVTTSIEEIQVK